MTWKDRLKSLTHHFVAIQLRERVRLRTASALRRLDDRLLADIGVRRHRIADYAREVAHRSVPVPPLPRAGRNGVLARLGSWRERRAAIRELSLLDDRLLRDIGIEPGRVGDAINAVLGRRRGYNAAHPMVQISDALQEVFVPARHRPDAAAPTASAWPTPIPSGNHAKIGTEFTPDVHALQARAANEGQLPEPRRRASAGV